MKAVMNRKNERLQDPPFARFLFADTRAAWIWLIVRIWLGWQWVDASMHKLTAPEWVQTGEAVKGFWERAIAIPDVGRPAITFDWYRSFLQMLLSHEVYTYMGPLIAYGEFLIGIGLIVGAFTGIAAFFGALLNWNFMMAGTASSNPLLFALAVGIILAWKVAGYVGADYFLLRFLGTPWHGKAAEPAPSLTPVTAAKL
ncbi:MAG: DoxX family membrane protein [Caldilineaceae bacterium]